MLQSSVMNGFHAFARKACLTTLFPESSPTASKSYEDDALGNLTKQVDGKAQVTTMVYDLLGRMIRRTEAEGTSYWNYDAQWIGALDSESSPTASKSYSYDGFGRVTSSNSLIDGQSYMVNTAYDNLGRISSLTYPTGLVIQRNYNAFHYMSSISNALTGAMIWQADSVDEFGHTTSESFGNGVSTTHSYDAIRGTLTGLQSTSNGADIQNWSYDYDAVGNMLYRADAVVGHTENFTYDNLNRLETVSNSAGVLQKSYVYDAIGNITSKSDVGSYTYDPNHPHAVQTAGGNSYAYDANGNQTSGAGRTLQWTSFNKASGIWTADGYTGFEYDANHNRITKTTPTSSTVYIGKIFEEITIGGLTKDRNHIYAGSKLVASIENNVGGLTNIKYMHGDHLGSISVITDELGQVVERLRFDVFGAPVNLDGTTKAMGSNNTIRGYTGHEMDASTGLINMNARLYDPILGRFLSADTVITSPILMQDFNRYSYVLNNPLRYTDPSGHSWWTNFRDTVVKPVITIAVAVAVIYFTAGVGSSWAVAAGATEGGVVAGVAGGAVSGAAAGFAGGATGTALYGGSGGQIWSSGLKGAGSGAIMGAVGGYYGDTWSLSRVGATSIAGGFAAKSSGGSFNSGFKMAGAFAMMSYSYNRIVGYDTEWKGGDRAVAKDSMDPPVKGRINIGTVTDKVDPDAMWAEGGIVSRTTNNIPGVNAVSGLHDQFQRGLEMVFGAGARDNILWNVGGMGIAAGVTYSGLVGSNPALLPLMVNAND